MHILDSRLIHKNKAAIKSMNDTDMVVPHMRHD